LYSTLHTKSHCKLSTKSKRCYYFCSTSP